jgi:hypothetical protein
LAAGILASATPEELAVLERVGVEAEKDPAFQVGPGSAWIRTMLRSPEAKTAVCGSLERYVFANAEKTEEQPDAQPEQQS